MIKKANSNIIITIILLIFPGCQKSDILRVLMTGPTIVSSISYQDALATSQIIDKSYNTISEHGHCWSEFPDPTIDDNKTELGPMDKRGAYQSNINNLKYGKTYYIRSYAVDSEGTIYGKVSSFSTLMPVAPEVVVSQVIETGYTSVIASIRIPDDGGGFLSGYGICYSTDYDPPQVFDRYYITDSASLIYRAYGMKMNSTYYLRAFATNPGGTSYSEPVMITTLPDPNTGWLPGAEWVDTRDARSYQTLAIGSQVWITEHINFGEFVISTSGYTHSDQKDNGIPEKYLLGNNEFSSSGGLYGWNEMRQYKDYQELEVNIQGVCPDGWHIPSDNEFKQLEQFVGVPENELDLIGLRGTTEGNSLKLEYPGIWKEPNVGADNSSGFSAYPGGNRLTDGLFLQFSSHCYLWSSTMASDTSAWVRILTSNNSQIERIPMLIQQGLSVRCVYDQ